MTETHFSQFKLIPPIQRAIQEAGYKVPTPIQAGAIPDLIEGHDLLGVAQTGTGKTAAFALPILHRLSTTSHRLERKAARTLILTPTRELAIQIHQSFLTYGKHLKLKYAVVFGGVGQAPQTKSLADGVDVLIATPGRLMDLFNQRYLRLDKVEIFVLDEADRMLDMGFFQDIKKILPLLPKKKQNIFFSATMPSEIQKLASQILIHPKMVEVTPASTTAEKIKQSVMYVDKKNKLDLLLNLLKEKRLSKVLVFVEMKHGADRVVEKLQKNRITSAAIHGNRSQTARQKALEEFKTGKIQVLVATDIASRGIDIDSISHVINFDIPHIPENYVHRIGRTARAGEEGESISFSTIEEKSFIFAIEKVTRQKIEVKVNHPYHSDEVERAPIMPLGKAKAILEIGGGRARKSFGGKRRSSGKRGFRN